MPKISVIIPTFNRADCIAETLRSVQDQTEREVEIILVDDGSADDTGRIVKRLAEQDPRILYHAKPNSGPAGARNFGLAKACGKFLAFLDSDDLWPGDYLTTMVNELESQPDYGAAYAPIAMMHLDGRIDSGYKKPRGYSGLIAAKLFERGFIWLSAAIFHRRIWEGLFFDETLNRSSEDSDALLRLSLRMQWVFVPKVQVIHRMRSDSMGLQEGVNPNRLLSLERWYFRLGGDQHISRLEAFRKLSHVCRSLAVNCQQKRSREASLYYFRKAIGYSPADLRLYPGWLRSWLVQQDAPASSWTPPTPLQDPCQMWFTRGRSI